MKYYKMISWYIKKEGFIASSSYLASTAQLATIWLPHSKASSPASPILGGKNVLNISDDANGAVIHIIFLAVWVYSVVPYLIPLNWYVNGLIGVCD